MLPTIGVLAAIVVSFVLFTGFYTDWLWFTSVDKPQVYTISILTMEVVDNAVVLLILAPCTRGWSTPPSGGGWAWPSWLPTPRPTRSTG